MPLVGRSIPRDPPTGIYLPDSLQTTGPGSINAWNTAPGGSNGLPGQTNIGWTDLTSAEALDAVKNKGAIFIDVRYPDEFAAAHYPGAVNALVSGRVSRPCLWRLACSPDSSRRGVAAAACGACMSRRTPDAGHLLTRARLSPWAQDPKTLKGGVVNTNFVNEVGHLETLPAPPGSRWPACPACRVAACSLPLPSRDQSG